MKKILFLIIVGALVLPLVIAGSGLTNILSFADVTGGWLEFSQTDFYMGEEGEPPQAAQANLSVINLGDSYVSTMVEADKDDRTYTYKEDCQWITCDVPHVQKWATVYVDPLVCEEPPPGCGDPFKSETIEWGSDGEAYLNSTTFTEGGTAVSTLSVYGKGGADGEWNSAGHVISSLDEGFFEYSYAALGDFCDDVDQCPTPQPDPPEPPERPDCEDGFCP